MPEKTLGPVLEKQCTLHFLAFFLPSSFWLGVHIVAHFARFKFHFVCIALWTPGLYFPFFGMQTPLFIRTLNVFFHTPLQKDWKSVVQGDTFSGGANKRP